MEVVGGILQMTDLKQSEQNVQELIKSMKMDLRKIIEITEDAETSQSILCEDARLGAKKLLMVEEILK